MFTTHNLNKFSFAMIFIEDTTPKGFEHAISDVYVHIKASHNEFGGRYGSRTHTP